jgi:autotransporter-associated beta strand protein
MGGFFNGESTEFCRDINFPSAVSNVKNLWTNYRTGAAFTNFLPDEPISSTYEQIQIAAGDTVNFVFENAVQGSGNVEYLRGAGKNGRCVGNPNSYSGYVHPIITDNTFVGADYAAWDQAASWDPALPSDVGNAIISGGKKAQATGGTFPTHLIVNGATLKLYATGKDTLPSLVLDDATIEGPGELSVVSGITLTSNTTFFVANGGELLVLDADLNGNEVIAKTGNGTLEVAQENSFMGQWVISGGVLKVASTKNLGSDFAVKLGGGGVLELDTEEEFLQGTFFDQNGVPLPLGTYSTAENVGYVQGAGKIIISDTKRFKFIAESETGWSSKYVWNPVHTLAAGDTGIVSGFYPTTGGDKKAYTITDELSFPAGATMILQDSAKMRLLKSVANATVTDVDKFLNANIVLDGGFIMNSTTTVATTPFGLHGTIAVANPSYIQVSAQAARDTATAQETRAARISLWSQVSGSGSLTVETSNSSYFKATYGVDVEAANPGYQGDWIVDGTSLVANATGSLGKNNKITLRNFGKLRLQAEAATDKSQTIEVEVNAGTPDLLAYTYQGIHVEGTHRVHKLVLGGQTFEAPATGKLEVTSADAPNYIFGTGKFMLGSVPVQSIEINTPLDVIAMVKSTTLQLTADVYPADADDQGVTWSVISGDATIDPSGLLAAGTTSGSVVVRAETDNGVSIDRTITVKDAATLISSITITGPASASLGEEIIYTAVYQPVDATDIELEWSLVTSGSATIIPVNNVSVKAITLSGTEGTDFQITATAKGGGTLGTGSTSITRATYYTWVANDDGTAGSDGRWNLPKHWDPQSVPRAGDTAVVENNPIEKKFNIGTGGQDTLYADFPAKLFVGQNAKIRISVMEDATGDMDPFTQAWDMVDRSKWAKADYYMNTGTLGSYTISAKTVAVGGTINVIDSSFFYVGAYNPKSAWYIYAEIKGDRPITIVGDESRTTNDVSDNGPSYYYGQSTIILRNSNPEFTGSWYLNLANLYSRDSLAFGKGDIYVGTGRRLYVDNEKSVSPEQSIHLVDGAKVGTKIATSPVTIQVANLYINGQPVPEGSYSSLVPAYAQYFEGQFITVKVGTGEADPVESIVLSSADCYTTGTEVAISHTVTPVTASPIVTWSVTPENLASVDPYGLLTVGVVSGTITVTATAADGTGVSASKAIRIAEGSCASSTSVDAEELKKSITLWPNPTNGLVNMESGALPINKVEVYSMGGSLLQSVSLSGARSCQVNLQGYPNGSYLMLVWLDNVQKPVSYVVVKQ